MSDFFDNTKIVGFAFLVVGFILIISAIFSIAMGFIDVSDDLKEGIDNWMPYCVVGGIGSLICALLYTFFALKVNNGTYSQKIVILEKYVRIVGITMIIDGIFAEQPVNEYIARLPHSVCAGDRLIFRRRF